MQESDKLNFAQVFGLKYRMLYDRKLTGPNNKPQSKGNNSQPVIDLCYFYTCVHASSMCASVVVCAFMTCNI